MIAALAITLVPLEASAQESVSVNRYSPGVLPTDGFWVRRPQTLGHLRVAAQMQVDFAYEPLVFDRIDNDPDPIPLVEKQLTTHASVALGFLDHFIGFVGMPVHVLLDGRALPGQPTATGLGPGDLYFGVGAGFATRSGSGGGGRITVSAPTSEGAGEQPGTAGESTSTLGFEISGAMPAGAISLVGNAALRFRQDKHVGTTSFTDEFSFGASAVYSIAELLDIHLELVSTASTENVAGGATTTMEASLGGKFHIDRAWMVGAAGGAGIAPAYGTPVARAIVLFGWQMPGKPRPIEAPTEQSHGYRSDPDAEWKPDPDIPPADPRPEPAPEAKPEPAPQPKTPKGPPKKGDSPAGPAPVYDDPAQRDGDGDGVSDLDDRCPRVPGEQANLGCARSHRYDPETGRLVFDKGIAFERHGIKVRSGSVRVLDEITATLKANPDFEVRIDAHTLADQGKRKAMKLSQKRAAVVAIELSRRGVEPARIQPLGCGARRPLRAGRSGRSKNERIEMWITTPVPKAGVPSAMGCESPLAPTSPSR